MALNPEERQAINDLFDRIRANGLAEKDSEAEALINQLVRRTPDSMYMLVQSVLIQESQIAEYEAQMDDQEARIRELESQLGGGPPQQQRGSGGFLGGGGLRRGSEPPRDSYRDAYQDDRRDERSSGIPPIGSRTTAGPYESGRAEPARMSSSGEPSYDPRRAPQGAEPPQRGGGGGFLRNAAAMAAGVAGGALLSNTLGGMFGGGSKPGEAQAGQSGQQGKPENSGDNDPGNTDRHDDDHDYHDDDDDGDWDGGGDEMEI